MTLNKLVGETSLVDLNILLLRLSFKILQKMKNETTISKVFYCQNKIYILLHTPKTILKTFLVFKALQELLGAMKIADRASFFDSMEQDKVISRHIG